MKELNHGLFWGGERLDEGEGTGKVQVIKRKPTQT